MDRYFDARYEWMSLLRRSDNTMRAATAVMPMSKAGYDFGVEASIQGVVG